CMVVLAWKKAAIICLLLLIVKWGLVFLVWPIAWPSMVSLTLNWLMLLMLGFIVMLHGKM
ncbi:MAG: hypothetical protein EBZ44_04835, partial [Verrucomicrobia bacterium]|nr:hypothetical protein [Verrucomicrobiota bacterium]